MSKEQTAEQKAAWQEANGKWVDGKRVKAKPVASKFARWVPADRYFPGTKPPSRRDKHRQEVKERKHGFTS